MSRISYLVRVPSGVYYFRRVISPALRPFMPAPWTGRSAWKVSLRTSDYAEAKRRADSGVRSRCNADFTAAERAQRGEPAVSSKRGVRPASSGPAMPSPDEVASEWLVTLLADDEAERTEGDARQQLQSPEERAQWSSLAKVPRRGTARDLAHVRGLQLEEQHAEYAEALGRSDPSIVEHECRAYLRDRGIPFDPDSDAFYEIGMAVLRGHVTAWEQMLERQRGKVVPTPTKPNTSRGPKLSEAYESWKAGGGARGSRKPGERTLLEADYAVRRLTEWLGDVRLGDLTREKVRDFRDALAAVPTRLPADLQRLPLRELSKRDLSAYPTRHAATVNKVLNILSAIVSDAEAAGRLDAVPGFKNPFGKGIKLVVDARAEEKRQPFSTPDLSAIFSTAVYRHGERPRGGGAEAAYWLPVLGLLTGARQGELAQLRLMDLAQDHESGVWHLDIGTAGGRSIKTASSRRKVPLHPELERIGLLRYRQSLIDGGAGPESPLWPHVEADNEGRQNGPWSKWFNRYLRLKAGISDRTKVFHSFRHTWKDMARNSGLPEDVRDAIAGHAGGGVGRAYGAGYSLKALAAQMAQVEVPGAVRDLRWEAAGEPVNGRTVRRVART